MAQDCQSQSTNIPPIHLDYKETPASMRLGQPPLPSFPLPPELFALARQRLEGELRNPTCAFQALLTKSFTLREDFSTHGLWAGGRLSFVKRNFAELVCSFLCSVVLSKYLQVAFPNIIQSTPPPKACQPTENKMQAKRLCSSPQHPPMTSGLREHSHSGRERST